RRFCASSALLFAECATHPPPPPSTAAAPPSPPPTVVPSPPSTCRGKVSAGPAATLPIGAPRLILGESDVVYLCRDAGGLYPRGAACTHEGCTVDAVRGGFRCPCHGSAFDANGGRVRGPADGPLPHYAVCVDTAGVCSVDPTREVAPEERVT